MPYMLGIKKAALARAAFCEDYFIYCTTILTELEALAV